MIADIVLLVVIALCIFLGYIRGLIKVAVRIIGFFVALIIALIFYTPVSNFIINNTEVVPNLQQTIASKIYEKDENAEEPKDLAGVLESYANGVKEQSSKYIAENAAIAIVRVGTWIGLFIIARILMIFIKIFANIIEKIPVIKQFNKARWYNIWYIRRNINIIFGTCSN